MMASGLVPELTAEAAGRACLGAGAKLIKVYSYEMNEDDIEEIEETNPEIFLLAGGTDGGNSQCILHNAKLLGTSKLNCPIIIAGNRTAARKCERLLKNKNVFVTENVMPKFGELNILPTQEKIREIFLDRIIKAKGLSKATGLISGILMPTPSAMMKAMELLAKGTEKENGIGELFAVDVGGATTDVYSVGNGEPKELNVVYKGLPEPYVKRTVEGDIGMRYGIDGIIEASSMERLRTLADLSEEKTKEIINRFKNRKDSIPKDEEEEKIDYAIACVAVETAAKRHAGTIEETYTPCGIAFLQEGKDLRTIEQLIFTGGALINSKNTDKMSKFACFNKTEQSSLRPKCTHLWVDRKYILAAMGVLSEHYPDIALRIMKKELVHYGI